jgi:hypothetical protein
VKKTEPSALYDELNARHWAGRLPRCRVLRRARLTALGTYRRATRTIVLLTSLAADRLRRVMLHEMCHVATHDEHDPHGARWLAELARLAAAGEPLAREEARRCGPRIRLLRRGLVIYDGPPAAGATERQTDESGAPVL